MLFSNYFMDSEKEEKNLNWLFSIFVYKFHSTINELNWTKVRRTGAMNHYHRITYRLCYGHFSYRSDVGNWLILIHWLRFSSKEKKISFNFIVGTTRVGLSDIVYVQCTLVEIKMSKTKIKFSQIFKKFTIFAQDFFDMTIFSIRFDRLLLYELCKRASNSSEIVKSEKKYSFQTL